VSERPVITVVGLGPGDPGMVTRAAWQALCDADELWLRTSRHPTLAALPAERHWQSFDAVYDAAASFADVYAAIVTQLCARVQQCGALTYAVPGHPLVAEATTRGILAQAATLGIAVRIIGGVSFIEGCCEALGCDPLDPGLQLVDALELRGAPSAQGPAWADQHGHAPYVAPWVPFPLQPTRPALIGQVFSRAVASDVKLTLLERYPAAHTVQLVRAAGVADQQRVVACRLDALDHRDNFDHLTSLHVPALAPLADVRSLDGPAAVVARLFGPAGCPWDHEQTHRSLRSALLEETYEALEALDDDDPLALAEELGDVLLQVLMHAEIGRQSQTFDLADVTAALATKLIRRHPHVFGDAAGGDPAAIVRAWEAIKREERAAGGLAARGPFDGIPPGLPALALAQQVARRAMRAGLLGEHPATGRERVDAALVAWRDAAGTDALGDVLFALTALAHQLGLDAESALREAVQRVKADSGTSGDLL
jgi:tetrapyrrole methylase family protein/MazG family protein